MTALTIISLSKSFCAGAGGCSARVSVLRDLDLVLWPGETVALVGSQASGRSTLLACAAGLLRPDAGSLFWSGARIASPGSITYACAAGGAGALFAAMRAAPLGVTRLLLVDDLPPARPIEQRLVLAVLQRHAAAGAAVLFSANDDLSGAPFVSRIAALENGALVDRETVQRRKRSAARIAASSPASRARVSARSTYGRSLRSPQ